MSTFDGSVVSSNIQTTPPLLSTTIDSGSRAPDFGISVTFSVIAGTITRVDPDPVDPRTVDGQVEDGFGTLLFERIIVVPRNKGVGFVLSATQFPVEVWNTFHDDAKDLTAITITGAGGIVIQNPFTLPKTIGPKDSLIFQALLPSSGPVGIDDDVNFVFAGIDGTDMRVIGSRILVFSVRPNWADSVVETMEYLTDVQRSYGGNERRRGLRTLPRRGLKFTARAMTARESGGMESLLWGWQAQPFGVPFWPDATALNLQAAAGEFTIQVDTRNRLFSVGGIAIIFGDQFTYEALTIDSMDDDSLTFVSPLQFSWKAGTGSIVIPCFLGRVKDSVDVDRQNSIMDDVAIEFDGEAQQLEPTFTASPTQFKGFDVLEVAPNWASDQTRNYQRDLTVLDPGPGPKTVVDRVGQPVVSHALNWWIDGHASIAKFRAFVQRRLGQQRPFWALTWDADLNLSAIATSGSAVLRIENVSYTRFFFPNLSRRYLALVPQGGGSIRYVQVTGSVDNGDGTESLTLSANLTADVPVNTMISFLTFCRMASDSSSIAWDSTELAEASIAIAEIPKEVPS